MRDLSDSEMSDFTVINSDDELPTDSIGDLSVVSIKGIIKEIIQCGKGYDKPGIGDEVFIECSENENSEKKLLKVILGNCNANKYNSTSSLLIPWAVELALRRMLIGEKSKILFQKNSVFSKPKTNGKFYFDYTSSLDDYKNYNVRSRKLVNLVKKNISDFDIYYVKLIDFCHIETISETIKKKIWKKGIVMRSPNKNDFVEISIFNIPPDDCSKYLGIRPNNVNNQEFNWIKIDLDLQNCNKNNYLIDLANKLKFNLTDFITFVLSMKIGEISEARFNISNDETISLLINLNGFSWKRKIPIRIPLKYNIRQNHILLSSYDNEKLIITKDINKCISKKISSINFDYNTKLSLTIKDFCLIDKKNFKKYTLNLPIQNIDQSKSVNLLLTPGFYTMPLWLEYSLKNCSLGGEYTLDIPYSLIFFFPPKELFTGEKTEIQESVSPLIQLNHFNDENNHLNSSNTNTYWDIEILIHSLTELGLFSNNKSYIESEDFIFQLKLIINTKEITENYVPFNLNNAKKEFYFYYNIGIIFNNYIDRIYNVKWNLLTLEILEKLIYIVRILPIYSKLFFNDNNDQIIEFNQEKNHKNNACFKYKNDFYDEKSLILKFKSIFDEFNNENLELDNIYLNNSNQNENFQIESNQNNEFKMIIHILTLIQEVYFEIGDYEKCIEHYNKYKTIIKFRSESVNLTILSAIKLKKDEFIKQITKEVNLI